MDAETAPSYGAIWDEFSEQHQHQSLFDLNKVQV